MENKNQVCVFAKRALGTLALVLISTSYMTQLKAETIDVNKVSTRSSMQSPRQVPITNTIKPQKQSGRVSFIHPKLPSNSAPSGRQRGAAGRGNCLNNVTIPLTALVPTTTKSVKNGQQSIVATNVWGLTVKERPTFLFYVPYVQMSAIAEFVLQDSEDNDIYRAPVTLPTTPGIVRMQLPLESAPLAVNRMYHWYFKVRCQQNMASPIFVEGWVQRVILNPTVTNQIATAKSLQQQVALYAKHGIWYDTAALLAQLRLQDLEDATAKADWYSILETIDLSTLASEAIKGIDNKEQKSLISDRNP